MPAPPAAAAAAARAAAGTNGCALLVSCSDDVAVVAGVPYCCLLLLGRLLLLLAGDCDTTWVAVLVPALLPDVPLVGGVRGEPAHVHADTHTHTYNTHAEHLLHCEHKSCPTHA